MTGAPLGEHLVKYVLLLPVTIIVIDSLYYSRPDFDLDTRKLFFIIWLIVFATILIYFCWSSGWIADRSGSGLPKPGVRWSYVLFATNPNYRDDYYVFLLLLATWSTAYLRLEHRLDGWVLPIGLVMLASLVLVFHTQSRGAWLGLGAGTAYFCWLISRRWALSAVAIVAIVFALGILVELGGSDVEVSAQATSAASTAEAAQNGNAWNLLLGNLECPDPEARGIEGSGLLGKEQIGVRLTLYANAILLWWQKPILGHGYYDGKAFAEQFELIDECVMNWGHLHNQFLEILVFGGGLLLAIYLAGAIMLFGALNRGTKTRYRLMAGALQAYLIYQMTQAMLDINLLRKEILDACFLAFVVMAGYTLSRIYHAQDGEDI